MVNLDRAKVEKQAKEILDKFASALEKVENYEDLENLQAVKIKKKQDFSREHDVESYVERDDFTRKEENGKCSDEGFRKRFLENALSHDNDFIIAEKGEWK